ncbi:Cell cycle checkpoint control protein RAD9B [Porphyridium purpureum]|uniref:Cell cycle checkpoint control protein RAD9B n=1 Tax=Porphyridium purpureum TaxID=35688 RepID=A0A5J4Z6A0_PORPP|nr:Cell cycle checkpoint control protein RAD9B [Porphyridium purpureum]|eukprot:POR7887..scf295_1
MSRSQEREKAPIAVTIDASERVRTFARVLACCSKIGSECVLHFVAGSLTVRTINAACSVCLECSFRASFFHGGVVSGDQAVFTDSMRAPSVAVTLSTVLLGPVAKSAMSARRLDVSCSPERDVSFLLYSKSGIVTSFIVPVEDRREIFRVATSATECSSAVVVRPRHLFDVLSNFSSRMNEVTFSFTQERVRVRSFLDEAGGVRSTSIRTEVSLDPHEFEDFAVPSPDEVELTVSYKAFRVALDFGEPLDGPARLLFNRSGEPMLLCQTFAEDNLDIFEYMFVFAARQTVQVSTIAGTMSAIPLESASARACSPGPDSDRIRANEGSNAVPRSNGSEDMEFDMRRHARVPDPRASDDEERVPGTPPESPEQ